MSGFKEAVGRAVAYIKSNTDIDSSIGIVFGSGLGGELENYTEIWNARSIKFLISQYPR